MRLITLLVTAALLQACVSTPQTRIEKNPAAYSALPPEQQQRVKEGSVGVGFDAAAVRLAIGEPDRIIERENAEGLTQLWVYYTIVPGYNDSGFCAPGFPYYGYAPYCRAPQPTRYEERSRVTFKDGRVVSVERAQ